MCCIQLGGQGEGKGRVEWVKFLLHTHQSLLLKLVSGDGGGTVRDETFLWKFLDISLTSPGELDNNGHCTCIDTGDIGTSIPLCTAYCW